MFSYMPISHPYIFIIILSYWYSFGDDSGTHDGEPICGPDYSADGFIRGNVNWISLIVLVLFYVAILMVGIIASWRNRSLKSQDTEDLILAKRNIGSWMALATLTGMLCWFLGKENDRVLIIRRKNV